MAEFIHGHLDYWFTIVLMCIGIYGMLFKRNLLKKLIGMSIFQTSIVLFYVAGAVNKSATVPVATKSISTDQLMNYLNPLPHTLMLTAIVVGVATLGVGFALLSMIYREHKTLEENEILEQLK
ncbi:MAG: cation:proton antiporter subunit C [Puniceicoccaceae bacterium]